MQFHASQPVTWDKIAVYLVLLCGVNNTLLNPGSATSQDGPTISTLDRVNSPQMKCYSLLTHHQTRMIFFFKEHNPKDFDGFCVCVCFFLLLQKLCVLKVAMCQKVS